jgi:hypothetical protein
MIAITGIAISMFALAVSAVTAWITLFSHGQILMTQPTVIYFGSDGSRFGQEPCHQKVFFRTLLYSTGKRGHIVENMFITLRRGETRQNFNIWVYGDDELRRGSGLFVPEGGVATNHHFLPPQTLESFVFSSGHYVLEVFATIIGLPHAQSLFVVNLDITQETATAVRESRSGIYFDWGPDAGRYEQNVKLSPSMTVEASALVTEVPNDKD